MVLGDAERVFGRDTAETETTGRHCGAAERVPRAGAVIGANRVVQRDSGASRNLVAHHKAVNRSLFVAPSPPTRRRRPEVLPPRR